MFKLFERIIDFLIRERKEFNQESRLVALYPDQNSLLDILEYREKLKELYDFSHMRELEPEEIHATVRWWPLVEGCSTSGLTDPIAEYGHTLAISKFLDKLIIYESTATIKSVEPLGESLSLMLESDSMHNIFSMVDDVVCGLGAPPSTYPSYIPHVALFYHESFKKGNNPNIQLFPQFDIVFDELKFVDNDDCAFLTKRLEYGR